MKKLKPLLLTFLLTGMLLNCFAQADETKNDLRTPFPRVLYKNNQPHIMVEGSWRKLISVANVPVADFVELVVDHRPTKWQRKFHEHFSYLMDELEIERGEMIKATIDRNGEKVSRQFMLKENNTATATAFHDSLVGTNRIQRKHSILVPDQLAYLNRRLDEGMTEDWISAEAATHDLEHLEWQIKNNFSYAELRGFDYQKALDVIRLGLKDGISLRDFAYQLKLFMANFGDGHSRVSMQSVIRKEEKKWLPFEIIRKDEKFYALDPKGKGFFIKDFPQVVAINEIPIEQLYDLGKEMVPKSTLKYVERNSAEYLNYTTLILKIAGVKDLKNARVTFSNGEQTMQKEFVLDRHRIKSPLTSYTLKDSLLENNIGYIAMRYKMLDEDEFIEKLHQIMQQFKNTKGLIIDIRRNSGGTRDPLKALLPYFIKETKICNVARYRVDKGNDMHPKYGYLEGRFMLPAYVDAKHFQKESEKNEVRDFHVAVAKFKKDFHPERIVSDDKFSDYHFMAIHPDREKGQYYYDKPVVVLIDEGCFSASDIFAAGIRQGDRVTLLGNKTGGGSGFSKRRRLPNSGLEVKLSRMFSYQPNGELYDGVGVSPDIELDYTLLDLLGTTDGQLEMAKKLVLEW